MTQKINFSGETLSEIKKKVARWMIEVDFNQKFKIIDTEYKSYIEADCEFYTVTIEFE